MHPSGRQPLVESITYKVFTRQGSRQIASAGRQADSETTNGHSTVEPQPEIEDGGLKMPFGASRGTGVTIHRGPGFLAHQAG